MKELKIIGIDEFNILHPESEKAFNESWERGVEVFKKIMAEHPEYCYYARPNEDFFLYEAKDIAEKSGASILILDNMS